MWKLRLEEMQRIDHHHHQQQQHGRSTPVSDVRRQDRLSRRRMSVSDLRSLRRPVTERRGLLDSLPPLLSRLLASCSRSLALLTPLTTADVLPATNFSSSSEQRPSSLEDEVD